MKGKAPQSTEDSWKGLSTRQWNVCKELTQIRISSNYHSLRHKELHYHL